MTSIAWLRRLKSISPLGWPLGAALDPGWPFGDVAPGPFAPAAERPSTPDEPTATPTTKTTTSRTSAAMERAGCGAGDGVHGTGSGGSAVSGVGPRSFIEGSSWPLMIGQWPKARCG